MNEIDLLLRAYEGFVALPWNQGLAGSQKVWFAIYDKVLERRLRHRVDEFALATQRAKHRWTPIDVTDEFPKWLSGHENRDAYFGDADEFDLAKNDFLAATAQRIHHRLAESDEETVVAILGVATLFGIGHVSELISQIQLGIRGRLLVFFPGVYERNIYRLLDARDGFNYLAIPITPYKGAANR